MFWFILICEQLINSELFRRFWFVEDLLYKIMNFLDYFAFLTEIFCAKQLQIFFTTLSYYKYYSYFNLITFCIFFIHSFISAYLTWQLYIYIEFPLKLNLNFYLFDHAQFFISESKSELNQLLFLFFLKK